MNLYNSLVGLMYFRHLVELALYGMISGENVWDSDEISYVLENLRVEIFIHTSA